MLQGTRFNFNLTLLEGFMESHERDTGDGRNTKQDRFIFSPRRDNVAEQNKTFGRQDYCPVFMQLCVE